MNTIARADQPIDVLLVEDSPADVRLMQEIFRDANNSIRLNVASDGVEAVAFLKGDGAHTSAPRPDLILLDLNLPRLDGREVLARIKEDENLKTIPTIVLTASDSEEDVFLSYRLQANCYLRKPAQWDAFESIVRSVTAFWLIRGRSPRRTQTE